MNLVGFAKNNLTQLPYFIGRSISAIPYGYRPGVSGIYRKRSDEMKKAENSDIESVKGFVFERVKEIAVYAFHNVPFYSELYRNYGVNPEKFKTFKDLRSLPVITKEELQNVPLNYRSSKVAGRTLVNTGGSSGKPLEFYVEPNSVGHEWAHMHSIWAQVGFKQSHLRIVFGGRSNVKNVVQYDSARHQINVDLYSGWQSIADTLLKVFYKYNPKYLHGYPSSIFDFVIWLDVNKHPLLDVFRQNIHGMLLGSELPSPALRKVAEQLLGCPSVSWYGHTERSVLAGEQGAQGTYYPFITYGFAECLDDGNLICTSYYNRASPLIRYDTGDCIEPDANEGLLNSFKISKGRDGEFVIDKLGNKIFLTGLVFGRHHPLFDYSRHIQIHQPKAGIAIVLVVPREKMSPEAAATLFDSSNVELDLVFKIIPEPIRTKAGKIPLLVKQL